MPDPLFLQLQLGLLVAAFITDLTGILQRQSETTAQLLIQTRHLPAQGIVGSLMASQDSILSPVQWQLSQTPFQSFLTGPSSDTLPVVTPLPLLHGHPK